MSEEALPAPPERVKNPVGVLVRAPLAGVSFALSQTLVIPALPEISHNVHASPAAASWILSGFLLSASISTPIVGKLGDVYGKGRVLTLTLLVFSAGGVVCALSHTIALLIAGRVIQGVAGGVFPLAFGIIRDTFPPERVASGLGLVSAILGIGARHRAAAVGRDRGRPRGRVALLDQPDRPAGGARRAPPGAAVARVGARFASTGSAPRSSRRRSRPFCSRSPRPTTGAGDPPRRSA